MIYLIIFRWPVYLVMQLCLAISFMKINNCFVLTSINIYMCTTVHTKFDNRVVPIILNILTLGYLQTCMTWIVLSPCLNIFGPNRFGKNVKKNKLIYTESNDSSWIRLTSLISSGSVE